MKLPAHLKYIFLAILLVGASINMLSTTHKIVQSSKRLEESEEAVLALKNQKSALEAEIEHKKAPGFIEKVARDKLNMILPNEEVFFFPDEETLLEKERNTPKTSLSEENVKEDEKGSSATNTDTYWEEWKNLLF